MSNPAPFCVLDEVDAPLDGANVERFADLLREFGEKSQMIVITHNPTTMEAAPVWYGVTMQAPGHLPRAGNAGADELCGIISPWQQKP